VRFNLTVGLGLLVVALVLFENDHHEAAGIAFVLGLPAALLGVRLYLKGGSTERDYEVLSARWNEAYARLDRGETPDQIAEAFERDYQILPTRTLLFIANVVLQGIDRERNPEAIQALASALSADRTPQLPPGRDLIPKLSGRRNILAYSPAVASISPVSASGSLLAARSYLYFFAMKEEDPGWAMMKARVVSAIPPLHAAHLTESLLEGVQEAFTDVDDRSFLKELEEAFHSPNSFAVPWREVTSVGKRVLTVGPIRTPRLVLKHGSAGATVERLFEFDFGLGRRDVDAWFDLVRLACALEGTLLPADPPAAG
jgi:hypothetical protein